MTLVIAGRNNNKNGLFVTADSHITQNNTVLVKGFKKVYEIPIRIKNPSFNGEFFRSYSGVSTEYKCFIAMAGSTLVAQHLINSIRNHLAELYPIYENGCYSLAMSCEQHRFLKQNHRFSIDMFTDDDIVNLVSANLISDIVQHSLQAVLTKAASHGGMRSRFKQYQAEFILGLHCPKENDYKLYVFDIAKDPQDSNKAVAQKHIIPTGKVAVIGMKNKYETDANTHYAQAVTANNNCDIAMHDFLISAIDFENKNKNNEIGKPAGLFHLEYNILGRIKLTS